MTLEGVSTFNIFFEVYYWKGAENGVFVKKVYGFMFCLSLFYGREVSNRWLPSNRFLRKYEPKIVNREWVRFKKVRRGTRLKLQEARNFLWEYRSERESSKDWCQSVIRVSFNWKTLIRQSLFRTSWTIYREYWGGSVESGNCKDKLVRNGQKMSELTSRQNWLRMVLYRSNRNQEVVKTRQNLQTFLVYCLNFASCGLEVLKYYLFQLRRD